MTGGLAPGRPMHSRTGIGALPAMTKRMSFTHIAHSRADSCDHRCSIGAPRSRGRALNRPGTSRGSRRPGIDCPASTSLPGIAIGSTTLPRFASLSEARPRLGAEPGTRIGPRRDALLYEPDGTLYAVVPRRLDLGFGWETAGRSRMRTAAETCWWSRRPSPWTSTPPWTFWPSATRGRLRTTSANGSSRSGGSSAWRPLSGPPSSRRVAGRFRCTLRNYTT